MIVCANECLGKIPSSGLGSVRSSVYVTRGLLVCRTFLFLATVLGPPLFVRCHHACASVQSISERAAYEGSRSQRERQQHRRARLHLAWGPALMLMKLMKIKFRIMD